MLIREWMTTNVISVTPETSMLKASKLMKENNIRRLPVVDDKKHVVGIVSDRDIKAASPSKASTLDAHELYYLLSELKVKGIMTPTPYMVLPSDPVEKAVELMEEKGIGGLPVVDETGTLVGVITDHDIYKVLIAISGARLGGIQFSYSLDDEPGAMCAILDTLREHKANIVSILTDIHSEGQKSQVYIRIRPMETPEEERLVEAMKQQYVGKLDYWVKDHMHNV